MKLLLPILFLYICLLTNSVHAATRLLLIGGGTRPPEAMSTFVQAAGGEKAKILICSWASKNADAAKNIEIELAAHHPASIEMMDKTKLKTQLASATGIFFTGGDQNKLMETITLENLKSTLKDAYQNGIVFGGTSAGTAVMSERMIAGDSPTSGGPTPLAIGLGLLPSEIIVDQHFIVRNRLPRLADLVLNQSNTYGIGIDEGTALFILNNRIARVIGPSQVILLSKTIDGSVEMQSFKNRDLFNLFGLKH
jgi:cyanophycinase